MSEKFRRYFLKSKDAKAILDRARERLGVDLEMMLKEKTSVELIETQSIQVYVINGQLSIAETAGNFFPTLVFKEYIALAPKVFVNMGAVPHVCNGANVMAPGIVRFEGEFKKGDLVVVLDEKHGKPLAIGEAIYDKNESMKVGHGVVVKTIHFVGDRVWEFIKRFEAKS
jgi:PUA domain protein